MLDPSPRMLMDRPPGETWDHRLSFRDRAGHADDVLRAALMEVFQTVNPAVPLMGSPPAVLDSAYFRDLYREGPVLYDAAAVDPSTGEQSERVAGLKVSAARLEATLNRLRDLNFIVEA